MEQFYTEKRNTVHIRSQSVHFYGLRLHDSNSTDLVYIILLLPSSMCNNISNNEREMAFSQLFSSPKSITLLKGVTWFVHKHCLKLLFQINYTEEKES
uniref:Uncharacterized protein n=1 Tax=Timema bartmani TaxID=61472 RepID=A0A7R9I4A3_9NEOP|nr:unnamed protein product [Timema bartmani]